MKIIRIANKGALVQPQEKKPLPAHRRRAHSHAIDELGERIMPNSIWMPKAGAFFKIGVCIRSAIRQAESGCYILIFAKPELDRIAGLSTPRCEASLAYGIDRTNAWLDELRLSGRNNDMKKVSPLRIVQISQNGSPVVSAAYFSVNSRELIEETNTGFTIKLVCDGEIPAGTHA
jgi:hypothetical protein